MLCGTREVTGASVPSSAWAKSLRAADGRYCLDVGMSALPRAVRLDDRIAYYDEGMRRWYVVSPEAVESYGRKLGERAVFLAEGGDAFGRGDVYSLWCASSMAEEMPEGWEPLS